MPQRMKKKWTHLRRHKILNPDKWKDIDWYTSIVNYEIGLTNTDSVDNLIQSPIKVMVYQILALDWILLRIGWNLPRPPLIAWLIVSFPMLLRLRLKIGHSGPVIRLQNTRAKIGRIKNDNPMDTLIRDVRGLYTVLIDQQVPEHIQRAMAHHEGEMYYCTHVEKMVRGNETELKGCPICQEFMDNE